MDGIDYKTTDMTKWGTGSGSGTGGNLTPQQADLNFWELYSRLKDLEDNPPEAIHISGMTVVGSQWQVNMSDGTHFGPFSLPIAIFELKGDWQNEFHYYELNLVTVPGLGLFLVRLEHDTPASPAVFDPNATDTDGHALYLKIFGTDSYIYDFGWFYPGRPGNGIEVGAAMAAHVLVRAVVLPSGLAGSKASLLTAPASALSFGLVKGTTAIGSINFAAGATVGTFTFTADVACAIDDTIRLIRPATVDTAARELSVTLLAQRS